MTLKIDAVDRKNQSVYLWLLAGIKRVFMSVCRIKQECIRSCTWQELTVRNKTCLDQLCVDLLNHSL